MVFCFLYIFPDADGDGIDDRWDACVDEPENFNGFLDTDGCPDIPGISKSALLDTDYDGIPDEMDLCPTIGERYNGFQDEDGCPDTIAYDSTGDADFDGVKDNVDQCPTARETYNQFQDTDGCPDSIDNGFVAYDSDGDGIIDNLRLVSKST